MSITKRAIFRQFMRGLSVKDLMRVHGKTVDWVESAIRQYMGRAFR